MFISYFYDSVMFLSWNTYVRICTDVWAVFIISSFFLFIIIVFIFSFKVGKKLAAYIYIFFSPWKSLCTVRINIYSLRNVQGIHQIYLWICWFHLMCGLFGFIWKTEACWLSILHESPFSTALICSLINKQYDMRDMWPANDNYIIRQKNRQKNTKLFTQLTSARRTLLIFSVCWRQSLWMLDDLRRGKVFAVGMHNIPATISASADMSMC